MTTPTARSWARNMQRQGVPLLQNEAPFVGTGLEERVARDSKIVVVATEAGTVASVDARRIVITRDRRMPRISTAVRRANPEKRRRRLRVARKFMAFNAAPASTQKPIVPAGSEGSVGRCQSPTDLH